MFNYLSRVQRQFPSGDARSCDHLTCMACPHFASFYQDQGSGE